MSDTGDRAVSALYITDPALSRPWSMALDCLPNQGQLDTSVPAHAVDLDAIRRAAGLPVPDGDAEWAVAPEHHRPRVVRHRRRRDARQLAARVAWWVVARIPAAVVIGGAVLLFLAAMRQATP